MPKLTSVAIDTNVALNFAALDELIIDCLNTIKKRLQNVQVIILPTVILELTAIRAGIRQNLIAVKFRGTSPRSGVHSGASEPD